jgi:integrase
MAGARKKPNRASGKYRGYYMDRHGERVSFLGTRDRKETVHMAEKLEDEETQIRLGFRDAPNKYKARPSSEVVREYLAWGNSQGGRGGRPWAKKHSAYKAKYLSIWQDRLDIETLGDLDGTLPKVEAVLQEYQNLGHAGNSLTNYAGALKSFCLWCERRGYLDSDPLKGLERFDTTPRKIYRALTLQEMQGLLAVIPEDRQLLYSLAASTGLRAGELRALRVSDLNPDFKALNLRAETTKNRKPGLQPLSAWLLERLQEVVKGKAPDAPLLPVPVNTTDRFYKDLRLAGIPRFKPGEGIATFHSLRVSFATMLMEEGADIKTAMTLMRHSTPDLTVNRYAKPRREKLTEFAETIGAITRTALENGLKSATGVLQKAVSLGTMQDSKGIQERYTVPSSSSPLGSF